MIPNGNTDIVEAHTREEIGQKLVETRWPGEYVIVKYIEIFLDRSHRRDKEIDRRLIQAERNKQSILADELEA